MTSKKFTLLFVAIIAVLISLHIILIEFNFFKVAIEEMVKLDVILAIVYLAGLGLIVPGLSKNPENFVGRFLILTTVQLLAAMSVLAALTYIKHPLMRDLSLHFISLFVILLGVQSILLVKSINRSK